MGVEPFASCIDCGERDATSMQASRQAASAFSRLPLESIAAEASVMTWVSNPSRAASIAVNETQY